MGIGVERQTKMADVLGRVFGMSERAQHGHRNGRVVRAVGYLPQQLVELPCLDLFRMRDL